MERLNSATGQDVAQLRIEAMVGSAGVGAFRLQLAVTNSNLGEAGVELVTLPATDGDLHVGGEPMGHLLSLEALVAGPDGWENRA